ncbi:MAG: 3-deoxy-D-manno-octulosonic acid transferase [Alphaproteobacteria bacterium]
MLFLAYRIFLFLGYPFLRAWIFYRTKKGKEDQNRLSERFGVATVARPNGTLFWFHGASVGESLTYLPVLQHFHMKYPDAWFLMTAGTKGAADILAKRLPSRCIHQYVPLDHPCFVKKFLKHWQPDLCFWTESDFWPVLLEEADKKTKIFLLNGHLSAKSFSFWKRFPKSFQKLMGFFYKIYPQTTEDKARFLHFNMESVTYLGNLKFATPPMTQLPKLGASIEKTLKERPFWIASNTHKGEEEIILQAHHILLEANPNLLLVLIPRHPARVSTEIIPFVESCTLSHVERSSRHTLSKENIYIVDTMGEVLSFYALSKIVFLGGSLVPNVGGHNLLEPLRFNNMVMIGPHMTNNQDMAHDGLKYKVVTEIKTMEDLVKTVQEWLDKTPDTKAIQKFLKKKDVLSLYIKAIDQELEELHVENA